MGAYTKGRQSDVNVASMSDFHNQDDELAVVDLAEDTVVADTVSPELAEVATEGLAELARVFAILNPLVKEGDHASAGLRPQLAQLLDGPLCDPIVPAHAWLLRW